MQRLLMWLQLGNPLYQRFQQIKDSLLHPIAKLAQRNRMTPHTITLFSLFLGLGSAWLLPWHYTLALGCLLLSSFCDALDGTLARLLNQSSIKGARLDYWCDVVVSVGLCAAITYWLHEPVWFIGLGLFILLSGVNGIMGSPLQLASNRTIILLGLIGHLPRFILGFVSGYAIIMISIFLLQAVRGKFEPQFRRR